MELSYRTKGCPTCKGTGVHSPPICVGDIVRITDPSSSPAGGFERHEGRILAIQGEMLAVEAGGDASNLMAIDYTTYPLASNIWEGDYAEGRIYHGKGYWIHYCHVDKVLES